MFRELQLDGVVEAVVDENAVVAERGAVRGVPVRAMHCDGAEAVIC